MADPARRLLVAGVTTRPLAVSAARAGWSVTAIDAFGDLDLRAVCAEVRVPSGVPAFHPSTAAHAARDLPAGLVAYTSNFENHPEAVTALARGRRLLGNGSGVLRRVRDPLVLARTLRRLGFDVPLTRAAPPRPGLDHRRAWLLKPRRSGGGHGTVRWRPGLAVARHQYLQERIGGLPGSVMFLGDGSRAHVLAISRQLVGRREFGASGFRYCGSLMGPGLFPAEEALGRRAAALAQAAVRAFRLVGLNCIDFVAREGVPRPIEVNPRWSASMELLERGAGVSLFALHAEACAGRLPSGPPPGLRRVEGKAVVFACRDVRAGRTGRWLGNPAYADVPRPGERIARGRPVCTVFATAPGGESCLRALDAAAQTVYRSVEPVARGAA
jgi:predicted ATP-grasp superfamily ATP-dependent carboligase